MDIGEQMTAIKAIVVTAIVVTAIAMLVSHVPESPSFTDQVQESLKGVVYIECPDWTGSGFVISANMIGTARHCLEGVAEFRITTYGGHILLATRAVADDQHDVAYLWIDSLECVNTDHDHRIACGGYHEATLHPLPLGSIQDCELGETVYVLGSPYGAIHFNALTTGIVSLLTMDVENFGVGARYGWSVLFMTDAATWGGSSGGPVFTLDGVVRGVLAGGHGSEANTSYCVPVDVFLHRIETIKMALLLNRYDEVMSGGRSDGGENNEVVTWPQPRTQ